MELVILPELREFIPPLRPEEREALRASIVAEGGATNPIDVWIDAPEGFVVLDGHNRYEICSELGLPFTSRAHSFADVAAAKQWMFDNQIARRNLSPDQLVMLAVLRGIAPPKSATPLQIERALVVAQHAKRVASVLSGASTIARQWGALQPIRKRAPIRPAAPAPAPVADPVEIARAKDVAKQAVSNAKDLEARLLEAERKLAWVHSAPAHPPVIKTNRSRPKSGMQQGTPCFVISDTHFGEVVTREGTIGLNEYNLEIAAQRMRTCWDNMLWLRADMARTNSCDDTYLALNGDIVSGDIHDELRETNEKALRGQCAFAVEALLPGIIELADATPGVLHIGCIGGNHGRVTAKQQIKNGTDHSFEHIGIYDPLRRLIGDRGGKIAWHVPEAERLVLTMHDRRVSQQHGTMIRSAGGIGGVLVPMTRWVTRDAMADLYVFGHFHEADSYGRIIKNGSLIGDSDYSRWLGVDPKTPPAQVAFVLHATHGVRRFERVSVT